MARALLLGKPAPLLGSLSLVVKSLWGRVCWLSQSCQGGPSRLCILRSGHLLSDRGNETEEAASPAHATQLPLASSPELPIQVPIFQLGARAQFWRGLSIWGWK